MLIDTTNGPCACHFRPTTTIGAVGSYAIGTQSLYFSVITTASSGLGFGMPQGHKSVVALGICMRNCGSALAPLCVALDVDQNAIVMVTLGISMLVGFSSIAARVFAARAGKTVEGAVV